MSKFNKKKQNIDQFKDKSHLVRLDGERPYQYMTPGQRFRWRKKNGIKSRYIKG